MFTLVSLYEAMLTGRKVYHKHELSTPYPESAVLGISLESVVSKNCPPRLCVTLCNDIGTYGIYWDTSKPAPFAFVN